MTEIEWGRLRAPELRALAQRDAMVVVPVGSVEQHGPHLPVQVDSLLVTEIARRAARRVAEREPIIVAPTVWSGLAEHHMSLGATLTLDFATFHALLRCICRSLVRHGFRRILLLNGHGGNIAALTVVVGELASELEAPITTATYWPLAKEAFAKILERQSNVRHACEAETSMMLALVPELIDLAAAAEARGPTAPELAEFVGEQPYRWRSFASRTSTGVIGEPAAASAEKGERLLNAAAEAVAKMLLTEELWSLPR